MNTESSNFQRSVFQHHLCVGEMGPICENGKVLAFIAMLLNAIVNILAKQSTGVIPPLQLTCLTGFCFFSFSLLNYFFMTRKETFRLVHRTFVVMPTVSGVLMFVSLYFENLAIFKWSPGNVCAMLYSSEVMTSSLLTFTYLNFRFKPMVILVMLSAILGVTFTLQPSFIIPSHWTTEGNNTGFYFAFGSGILGSILYTISSKCLNNGISHHLLVLIQAINFLIGGAISILIKQTVFIIPSDGFNLFIVLSTSIIEAAALMTTMYALDTEPTFSISIILTTEVLVTYLLESITLNINSSWLSISGACLITCACVLSILSTYEKVDISPCDEKMTWIPLIDFCYKLEIVEKNQRSRAF